MLCFLILFINKNPFGLDFRMLEIFLKDEITLCYSMDEFLELFHFSVHVLLTYSQS